MSLRWFLSIALRIPTAHAICVICAHTWARARTHERVLEQNVSDFPQRKLDSEINAPFLLNKDGDLYFSLHKNIEHIILFNFLKI